VDRRVDVAKLIDVGFEILTAMVTKRSVLWYITPCSQLKVNRRFGGTFRLHIHGQRISQARNQQGKYSKECQAGFLLGLFFDREYGSEMFL
jgi:hypothetical protein